MTMPASDKPPEDTNIVETLQSLIVAFALAMAVRSFVTEGFFIPTGSMAPTLMGSHVRIDSGFTGYEYPVDSQVYEMVRAQMGPNWQQALTAAKQVREAEKQLLATGGEAMRAMTTEELNREIAKRFNMAPELIRQVRSLRASWPMYDPMLSNRPLDQTGLGELLHDAAAGDRVLVLKYLYSFQEPKRWDVVVFKNPTNPTGDDSSYIKRLVGLPEEQLLFLDGDVFTAPLGADRSKFTVQRKPEYIQRAVWQAVSNSDYVPVEPAMLVASAGFAWPGPPWNATGFTFGAKRNERAWRSDTASPSTLSWRTDVLSITDFVTYNIPRIGMIEPAVSVSDVRVCAAIVADDPAKLATEFALETRGRVMRFSLRDGKALLAVDTAREGPDDAVTTLFETSVALEVPDQGEPFEVEFWHVDQRMTIFVNGDEVMHLDYTFDSLEDRLLSSFNGYVVDDYLRANGSLSAPSPKLDWKFEGSPLTLHRVRVDRDLYYRATGLSVPNQFAVNGEPISGAAFATNFAEPSKILKDQFVMCGDNSCASKDSRLWGRPSPIVTRAFEAAAPFIVPRPLLLGKAWCVYFPAPMRPTPTSPAIVPDFGQLRFIR